MREVIQGDELPRFPVAIIWMADVKLPSADSCVSRLAVRLHHIYPPFTGSEKRSNYTKDASLSIKRSQIHGNIVHCINKHQQEGATVIIIFASCSSDFLEHQR